MAEQATTPVRCKLHVLTLRLILNKPRSFDDVSTWLPGIVTFPALPHISLVSKGRLLTKSQPDKFYEFFDLTFDVEMDNAILPHQFSSLIQLIPFDCHDRSAVTRMVITSEREPSKDLGLSYLD